MCDNKDSGFELAYANEVTVDGKRSPRGKGFVYELKRSGFRLIGRSWAESGLGWVMPRLPHLGALGLGFAPLVLPVAVGGQIWWLAKGKGREKGKERKRKRR